MKFISTTSGTVGGTAGLVLSVALHLAIVVAYNLGTSGVVRSEPIEETLPEGLRFLVPPSASPEQPMQKLGYRDPSVGSGETMDEAEEARLAQLAELARRRGIQDSLDRERASLAAAVAPSAMEDAAPSVFADAYMEIDVDSAASRHPESAAPAYPPELMRKGISGFAAVRFVVDTNGMIDLASAQRLDASHEEFWEAVRAALPKMRFYPARRGATAVRQLAEQMFRFEIKAVDSATKVPPPAPTPGKRPPA